MIDIHLSILKTAFIIFDSEILKIRVQSHWTSRGRHPIGVSLTELQPNVYFTTQALQSKS